MSINTFAYFDRWAVALTFLLGSAQAGSPTTAAQGGAVSSYYKTVGIEQVLTTRPAVVYVSPQYQVTIQVPGDQVTGVSLELSKQKDYSVTLADNHHMIFLDTLTKAGGADLNLILNDETVLPLHLMVQNSSTGTRIYSFVHPEATVDAPSPASPGSGGAPGEAAVQPAEVNPRLPTAAVPTRAARGAGPEYPAPASGPAGEVLASAESGPARATPVQASGTPSSPFARLSIRARRSGNDVTMEVTVTSLGGALAISDLKDLRVRDGTRELPLTVLQPPRGRVAPLTATINIKVTGAPKDLQVYWSARSLFPAATHAFYARLEVK